MKIYTMQDNSTFYWSHDLGWTDEDNATDYVVLPTNAMPIGWSGVQA